MIELLVIWFLWGKFGELLHRKGYTKTFGYQILLPVFWFGGQFAATIFYVTWLEMNPGTRESRGVMYLTSLMAAAVATALLYRILRSIPDKEMPGQQYLSERYRR
jgi:hypothetical protein